MNYGEPDRQFYCRSGEESKNNPLANTQGYGDFSKNHTGKKVEEKVSAPVDPKPKFQMYMLNRIKDKCNQRGERGLFGLKKVFTMFDVNGNGTLDYKEFSRALNDFKLDLEEVDIQTIFKSFDKNGDGVLDLEEFMDLVVGQLNPRRRQVA